MRPCCTDARATSFTSMSPYNALSDWRTSKTITDIDPAAVSSETRRRVTTRRSRPTGSLPSHSQTDCFAAQSPCFERRPRANSYNVCSSRPSPSERRHQPPPPLRRRRCFDDCFPTYYGEIKPAPARTNERVLVTPFRRARPALSPATPYEFSGVLSPRRLLLSLYFPKLFLSFLALRAVVSDQSASA